MSSLKEKFDDYREEPQYASWQQLLQRLSTELPVRKKRRYLLWILPLFFIGPLTAWWFFSTNTSQPLAQQSENAIQNSTATPEASVTSATLQNTVKINEAMLKSAPNNPSNKAAHGASTNTNSTNQSANSHPNTVATATTQTNSTTLTSENNNSINRSTAAIKRVESIEREPLVIHSTPPIVTAFKGEHLVLTTPIKPNTTVENKFVLEIFYAPGISNMMIKTPLINNIISSKTIASNVSLRKSISKMGFGYSTGFGLKMDLNNNFRVKTGYYFTQVNQTIYYNTEPANCHCGSSIALSQVANITELDMLNIGDTISKGNSNSFTNKYSLREIPLVIEYARPTLKYPNLNYVLNLGMSYMYMSGLNIITPDADNVGFMKTTKLGGFPTYKDAFNVIAGGGLLFRAKRNVEYMIAPQFKLAVTSLSKNDHWLREYPWQMQVAFGIGKRF